MTNSRCLHISLLACALTFAGGALAAPGVPESATPPEMYSFTDVYRLTVNATYPGAVPAFNNVSPSASAGGSHPGMQAALAESMPLRPIAAAAGPGEAVRFFIGKRHDAEGWLMALAGFVLAGWVAARRLA